MGDEEQLSPEVMERMAFIAAQQKAMSRGGKDLPHGSRLFTVEQGWESTVLARGEGVMVTETLLALEQALRTPENKIILIPLGAIVTDGDIEKLCQRNGVTRALFREVKKS